MLRTDSILVPSLLLVAGATLLAAVGCSNSNSPTGGGGVSLVLFTDPLSGIATNDIRDVDHEILRFDTAGRLIWVASGQTFAGFVVDGNSITNGTAFQIRFGPPGAAPRAYFTEHGPATICDVSVTAGGALQIAPTAVAVPK